MSGPPEVKGVTPKRIWQKIKSEKIFEQDLEFDPSYVPWIYVENVLNRVLARMVGQGPYGPVTVKCTKDGSLAVVARGGAFDDYERLEWSFSAAGEIKEFQFTEQVERIDIFTYSDRVDYQLTRDLVKNYGPKIELFEDSFYSLDFYTLRVRATCVSYSPNCDGSATSTSAGHLVDSAAQFQTDKTAIGMVVANITDQTYATVTAINSETDITLSDDIFEDGDNYTIDGPRVKLMGWFQAKD